MTKIMPPYVFKYSGLKPEDWGLSGFVLIAESHISVHTFPEKNFLSADIFSCKHFDIEFSKRHLVEVFGIQKVESNVLDRGTEFPKEINGAASLVRTDRMRVARTGRGRLARAVKVS
jgi:S-adenosylmethionine decarboxylase